MILSRTIKIWILVCTAIFFVIGCVLTGVGSWIVSELNAYTALSPSVSYAVASELILVAGVLLFTFSFFFCVSCKDRCSFIFYFLVFLVVLGLEISGAALGYKNRDKIKETLSDDVVKTIREVYGIKTDPSSAIDALQEKGECCGWYNYTDWRGSRFAVDVTNLNDSVVPDSCCVKGPRERFHCGRHFSVNNIYTKGCQGVFLYKLIRDKLYYVAILGTTAIVFQVFGMLPLLLLIFRKKQEVPYREVDEEPICSRSEFWKEVCEDLTS